MSFNYDIHPMVTIISKNPHFTFIQLMMYIVFIINYIHHLMNESKMLIFVYNSDRKVYMTLCLLSCVHQTCDMINVYHVYIISYLYRVSYHILSFLLKKKSYSISIISCAPNRPLSIMYKCTTSFFVAY